MAATIHVNSLWLVGVIFTALFAIVYPLVLAIIAHQRLKVSWKYFGFGVVIFRLREVAPSTVETQPAMPSEAL